MNPRYDTNTNPPWLKKGIGDDLSTCPLDAHAADPREPGFHCAKSPSQRMMEEIRETLATAQQRSSHDFEGSDHPYACLSGALQADITALSNTLELYLKTYGLELMA